MAAASNVPVETLVFMDIETTGLKRQGVNPEITEIFMRAVDRKMFLSKAKYKAENSIKLVFKPKQKIEKIASELTVWILTSNMAAASSVPVETLVFMHSKASDSSKDGENPRITEICMRAVSRKHFLSRALNKHENTIKLVAMPKDEKEQTVSKVAAEKEKQESKQESLDAADAELLKSFLLRLKKPVCIVAYSGKTYDFRFLKLLLNKVQGGPISDLLYADTFEGFKVILKEKLETQMEILSLAGSSLHVIYERMFGKPKFNIHFTESNVEMMYEITLKNAKVFMGWIDQNAHK